MEKLLRYFLKFTSLLILCLSCNEGTTFERLSPQAKKSLSEELLKIGENQYEQGSPDNMKIIELALEVNPNNSYAWRELSVPYLKRGIANKWKPLFDKAVEVDPISWQGWRGYLKLYFYRDYRAAIDDFNATDTLTPNFTDFPQGMSVHYLRGLAYLGLKDYSTSIDYLTKYINEETIRSGEKWVDVNAFLYRGIVYEYLNKLDLAEKDFRTHLKYYASSSDGYFHLSKVKAKMGDTVEAKLYINSAAIFFDKGYYLNVPYVEAFEQIYQSDILALKDSIEH